MTNTKARLVLEIRQNSNDVTTDDPDITDVTVVENTFPPKRLHRVSDIRVYLDDTHDEAIDVTIAHTHTNDDDFSGENEKSTVSLTSGADQGNVTLAGPLGKIRAKVLASGAAAAPTTGQLEIEVLGVS